MNLKNITTIYHSKDLDGIASYIATMEISLFSYKIDFSDPELNQYNWYRSMPTKTLLFIDITPSLETLSMLLDNDYEIIIIDHHETAYNQYRNIDNGNFVYYYNTIDSACLMAFNIITQNIPESYIFNMNIFYCFGYSDFTYNNLAKLKNIFALISDQDTWKWVANKRYSCLILDEYMRLGETFETALQSFFFSALKSDMTDIDMFIYTHPMFLNARNKVYLKSAANVKTLNIANDVIHFTLSYGVANFYTQQKLFAHTPIIATFYCKTDNTVSVSMRTILDDFHVGQYLSEKFGGGGHQKAGGCSMSYEQFLSFIQKDYETVDNIKDMLS